MNHIRAITTRIIIAASVALCAIVVVPDLTFAAPDCNLKRNTTTTANLSGCNLTGANLRGDDLSRADLFRANLSNADLTGARLARANLEGATLSRADFTDADLTNAVRRPISLADLRGVIGLDTVTGLIEEGETDSHAPGRD